MPTNPFWPDADVARLRELWAANFTASQIAVALASGYTRSSVLGKVHRLMLPPRAVLERKEKERKHRKSPLAAILPDAPQPQPPAPKPAPAPIEEPIKSRRIGILALTSFTCRYMLGEPQDGVYCGAGTDGGSWCPGHRQIVYRPWERAS